MLHSCCWQYRRDIICLPSSNRAWRLPYSWKSNRVQVGELFLSVRASDSLFCYFPSSGDLQGKTYPVILWTLHTCKPLSGFRGVGSKGFCTLVRKEDSGQWVRLEAAHSMGRAQTRSLGWFSHCALPTTSEADQVAWEQILEDSSTQLCQKTPMGKCQYSERTVTTGKRLVQGHPHFRLGWRWVTRVNSAVKSQSWWELSKTFPTEKTPKKWFCKGNC